MSMSILTDDRTVNVNANHIQTWHLHLSKCVSYRSTISNKIDDNVINRNGTTIIMKMMMVVTGAAAAAVVVAATGGVVGVVPSTSFVVIVVDSSLPVPLRL